MFDGSLTEKDWYKEPSSGAACGWPFIFMCFFLSVRDIVKTLNRSNESLNNTMVTGSLESPAGLLPENINLCLILNDSSCLT